MDNQARQGVLLFIEDGPFVAQEISRYLKGLRYEVNTVPTRDDAIPLVETTCFDLILMDYITPGVTGPDEFVNLLRRGCANRETPVVIMTAWTDVTVPGIDTILEKPVDIDLLTETIHKEISRRRDGGGTSSGNRDKTSLGERG